MMRASAKGIETEDKKGYDIDVVGAIAWQDTLLQSYRNLQLLMQSIFLAVGVGLVITLLSTGDNTKKIIVTVLLWAVGTSALSILFLLWKVIRARGNDVYHWQRNLIQLEYARKSEKLFARFKIDQILRKEINPQIAKLIDVDKLTKEQVDCLVTGSDRGMRKTVERTIHISITILWLLLFGVSILVTIADI